MLLVLPGFRINLKHATSCDLQAVYFWTTFLPIRCILFVNSEFRCKSLHFSIQFKLRKHTSTTYFSIRTNTLKIFNTYNIVDKLRYGFINITTYFCTDDVHSNNHHCSYNIILQICIHYQFCKTNFNGPNLYLPEDGRDICPKHV